MIRRAGGVLLALFALGIAVAGTQTPAVLEVTGAWVREPVPGRPMTAAYAVIENRGTKAVEIVGAAADAAGTVEMHEMVRAGDVMRMAPVKGITVPGGGKVELKPGGLHLMLFALKRPLKDGDAVALTFSTSDGGDVTATAAVKKAQM